MRHSFATYQLRFWLGILIWIFLPISLSHSYVWNTIEINPDISVSESYDDNVTYRKNDPIGDAITKIVLGIDMKKEGKTHLITIDADIAQQLFAQHSSFNNVSETLGLSFQKEISKYDVIKIKDAFSHSEEPRSFEDSFGRAEGRYFTYYNLFEADYRHDFNDYWALDTRYGNEFVDFTRKDLSASSRNSIRAGINYTVDAATILSTDYDFHKREFDPGSSSEEQEFSLGLRRYFTTQLYLDAHVGADLIKDYQGGDHTEPRYEIGLTTDIDKNTQTGFLFEKEHTTTAYTQDIFDMWKISVGFAKQLTDRLRTAFAAFYGEGEYIHLNRESMFSGAGVNMSYDLSKKIKANFSYVFTNDDSNQVGGGYTKNTVLLGILTDF
ncbi:MAG: hypothetical protein NUV91_07860 [Candidatus Omnitrophica bacterium]|nr:hypothetical protein [Candidatus Omnitrophota bacterium]